MEKEQMREKEEESLTVQGALQQDEPKEASIEDGSSPYSPALDPKLSPGPEETKQPPVAVQPEPEPRMYSCKYCPRKFRSWQALGGHQNRHKFERSFDQRGSSSAAVAYAAHDLGFGTTADHIRKLPPNMPAFPLNQLYSGGRQLGVPAHSMIRKHHIMPSLPPSAVAARPMPECHEWLRPISSAPTPIGLLWTEQLIYNTRRAMAAANVRLRLFAEDSNGSKEGPVEERIGEVSLAVGGNPWAVGNSSGGGGGGGDCNNSSSDPLNIKKEEEEEEEEEECKLDLSLKLWSGD